MNGYSRCRWPMGWGCLRDNAASRVRKGPSCTAIIGKTMRAPLWLGLIFNVAWGIPTLLHYLTYGSITVASETYILIGFVILINSAVCEGLYKAWRLSQDLSRGTVIIIRLTVSASIASTPANTSSVAEYLPRSRRLWTQNGQPAPWRIARMGQIGDRL